MPDLIYPVILGIDLLRTLKAQIILQEGLISLSDQGISYVIREIYPKHEFKGPSVGHIKVCSTSHSFPEAKCSTDDVDDLQDILAKADISTEGKNEVANLLTKYKYIFTQRPGLTNEYEHEITLMDNKPFSIKPYPIPVAHRAAVQQEIQRMET